MGISVGSFLFFTKNQIQAEENLYQRTAYTESGMAFYYINNTKDLVSKNQIQDYIQRRVAEIKAGRVLKNYLPELKGYLIDWGKDVTSTGTTTYQIKEQLMPNLAVFPVSFARLPFKQTEFETISSQTGNNLTLAELFTDPQHGINQLSERLTEKIKTDTYFPDTIKTEIRQQLTQQVNEETTHYQVSNQEILFQFASSQGTVKIGLTKNELRRSLKTEYMTPELNQKVAAEIQQEELERQQEEERLKRIREQQAIAPVEGKVIALTFDDGPDPALTPKILATLAKYNAKATFFILGKNASAYPNLLQQEIAGGHEIGNHSWSHPDLASLPKAAALDQINKTNKAVLDATGYPVQFMRPPYGSIKGLTKDVKMPIVEWSVDTLDWKTKNSEAVYQEVMRSSGVGSIVLMHDIQPATADALDRILKELTARGYKFVTISELFGTPMQAGTQYFSKGSTR